MKEHLASRVHASYDEAVAEFNARMSKGAGAANAAGAKMQAKPRDPTSVANAAFTRPGYWDPKERLSDMDLDGVDAEVLYSEVSAFRFLSSVKDGVGEAVAAFNDSLHAFSSADPSRLIVSYQIPIHDIELAVKEVQRVAALGAKSLQLPVFPVELGQLDYVDPRYDPLWATIEETGLPICLHIGLKTSLSELMQRDPTPQKAIMVSMTPLMTAESFGMWVMGGILARFPKLKLVFVEPGIAWVAWWLETADDMVKRQGYEFPAITELPSHYFRKNVSLTFIDETLGLERTRDIIGVENLMWSTDFPHPVTTFPHSVKVVDELFANIPQAERDLMVCRNAERIWGI